MGKLYNLARMTTATTGTGTITLGSAVAGFLSFAGAGVSDAEVVTYAISDGSASEIGTGTYTSSGTTLSRTVLKSTNSGSAINLSGSAQVMITPSAADIANKTDTATQTFAAPVSVGTSNAVTAGTIELGHASDTTLARGAAGKPTVEGSYIKLAGVETIWIPASAMTARTTNGAAAGTVESTTNKVMLKSLDFDTTTQEFAQFAIRMPKSWNEGTVTASCTWTANSTSTNSVVWAVQGVALTNDETADTAFGTEQTSTDANTSTAYQIHTSPATSAITIGSSPAAEDWVVFQVKRNVSDGSDTLAVDALLLGVTLYITTDAANDA